MEEFDITSVILRGTHTAALASLFGTLVFQAFVIRWWPDTRWAITLRTRLARLTTISLLLSLSLGIAWLIARTAAIAGASTLAETLEALPLVALDTRFGRLLLLRFALLLVLLPLCLADRRWLAPSRAPARATAANGRASAGKRGNGPSARPAGQRWTASTAIALAAGALALQAASSHAGAMEGANGRGLVIAETLHVLAAGAWLGGLLPLLICLATMPAEPLAGVLRRFFPLGVATVLIIAATSLVQALYLVGSVPALVGTPFGLVALGKTALFVALLGFAALNRFVFSGKAGGRLRRSIVAETTLAVLTMLAAGTLAHLTPGVHEQPIWPFAWRPNPAALGPVLVQAYPTSFFASPTGFSADAILRGQRLYQASCASCHGTTGQGNGVSASSLPVAPPDLTTDRIRGYPDGDLFWLAGHAIATPPAERWDLVDYLRAHATGEFVRGSGRGRVVVRTPTFGAICAGGNDLDPGDDRGKVLRILVSPDVHPTVMPLDPDANLLTIRLPATDAERPGEATCLARPDAVLAFAILLGTTPDGLAGNEILIDANGWLRARWRPGLKGGWPTPEALLTRMRALARNPLPADPASGHIHHQ
jgi:putative copper export protein/mono/diheme cytochrome c family protein